MSADTAKLIALKERLDWAESNDESLSDRMTIALLADLRFLLAALEAAEARARKLAEDRETFVRQRNEYATRAEAAEAQREKWHDGLTCKEAYEAAGELLAGWRAAEAQRDTLAEIARPFMPRANYEKFLAALAAVEPPERRTLKATGDEPLDVVNSGAEEWVDAVESPEERG
jgi:hypothetical protein